VSASRSSASRFRFPVPPAAQLRLGDLCSTRAASRNAIGVFERVDDPAARAGKPHALIDLGRTDDAPVILEAIGSDPNLDAEEHE
jgi:hypothetical protein